jgi:hypothetical protein
VEAEFVPRAPTAEEKGSLWIADTDLLDYSASGVHFLLGNIVTGDDTWTYGYDPETKTRHRVGNPFRPHSRRNLAKVEARQQRCSPISSIKTVVHQISLQRVKQQN